MSTVLVCLQTWKSCVDSFLYRIRDREAPAHRFWVLLSDVDDLYWEMDLSSLNCAKASLHFCSGIWGTLRFGFRSSALCFWWSVLLVGVWIWAVICSWVLRFYPGFGCWFLGAGLEFFLKHSVNLFVQKEPQLLEQGYEILNLVVVDENYSTAAEEVNSEHDEVVNQLKNKFKDFKTHKFL